MQLRRYADLVHFIRCILWLGNLASQMATAADQLDRTAQALALGSRCCDGSCRSQGCPFSCGS